jgi:NADPH:quinone reductase-like Zn-dependent oxidoreductase
MVGKLWDFFAGVPLSHSTRARLVRVYRGSGLRIRPVVGAIIPFPEIPAAHARMEARQTTGKVVARV